MGRYKTGAWTVHESIRLELSYLLWRGLIKKNCLISSILTWSKDSGQPTATIGFRSSYFNEDESKYVELSYTNTDRNGQKTDYRYKIYFVEVPSNLGKGKVLYFQCPRTGKKCRILYMAYGYPKFMSRGAYSHRLYYDCQQASKMNRYNDNYWRIDKHISNLKQRGNGWKRNFKGRPTKAALRYERLMDKQMLMDDLRWSPLAMPLCVRKEMATYGVEKLR